MRVLITGGGGFLGAWLTRRLVERKTEVRVLDLASDRSDARRIVGSVVDDVDWRAGDVSDGAVVRDATKDCDAVVHLAGMLTPACQANPIRGAQVNLIGALNVFEAAKHHGFRKLIYASTAGVYGPDDGRTPRPTTHYGAFKLAVEGSARSYWENEAIPSIGFRPFVVYGPGREVGLSAGPSLACRAVARGEPYVIPFRGATGFIYVDDVTAALEAALSAPPKGAYIFNLVGEVATVDQFIAEIVRQAPEAELRVQGSPLPISPHVEQDNLEKALGNIGRTRLPDGIAATIAWYRRQASVCRAPA
jgi:nucleoside-diphosphate-sugar epimerase